jgi:hypothetical protein
VFGWYVPEERRPAEQGVSPEIVSHTKKSEPSSVEDECKDRNHEFGSPTLGKLVKEERVRK